MRWACLAAHAWTQGASGHGSCALLSAGVGWRMEACGRGSCALLSARVGWKKEACGNGSCTLLSWRGLEKGGLRPWQLCVAQCCCRLESSDALRQRNKLFDFEALHHTMLNTVQMNREILRLLQQRARHSANEGLLLFCYSFENGWRQLPCRMHYPYLLFVLLPV